MAHWHCRRHLHPASREQKKPSLFFCTVLHLLKAKVSKLFQTNEINKLSDMNHMNEIKWNEEWGNEKKDEVFFSKSWLFLAQHSLKLMPKAFASNHERRSASQRHKQMTHWSIEADSPWVSLYWNSERNIFWLEKLDVVFLSRKLCDNKGFRIHVDDLALLSDARVTSFPAS